MPSLVLPKLSVDTIMSAAASIRGTLSLPPCESSAAHRHRGADVV